MTKRQEMKDILSAIKSVKFRAISALNLGEMNEYSKLMFDLMALEVCLVSTAESFIEEDEKKVA